MFYYLPYPFVRYLLFSRWEKRKLSMEMGEKKIVNAEEFIIVLLFLTMLAPVIRK